jgi:thymidylate synthase ThyX
VKIIADSVNPVGNRVTTFELTYPRFVHAELMTHRLFCLAGDTQLEFDLPGGQKNGKRRVHRMRLDEFVDKWAHGARREGAKPKCSSDLSWVENGSWYAAPEIAARLGMASASNINGLCRVGLLPATRENRTWFVEGSTIRRWRESTPDTNRYDMRARLQQMQIRQLNEDTGDIQTSHVVNAVYSGHKQVYDVHAGDYTVSGSLDHRVLTTSGWKTIGDLTRGDLLVVRKFGKRTEDRLDPLRLKKIDGVWRSRWQNQQRERLQSADALCRRCRVSPGVEIHHIIPVHENRALALVEGNITLLCNDCHQDAHHRQGWQGGTYLYGSAAAVDEVIPRAGKEPTFDLEIAGDYANFLANGVVVHNSRNSASSRAIPTKKLMERIDTHPVMPKWWGKNQSGMEAQEELPDAIREDAKKVWLAAKDAALTTARELQALGLHKQIANRVLEPWMFITVIVTATEYDNWFHLRCSPHAQPEIAWVAYEMRRLYEENTPDKLDAGMWHLPYVNYKDHDNPLYVNPQEPEIADDPLGLVKISTARCARVSYLTHDGWRDLVKDIELHNKLSTSGHWSPFEHAAEALDQPKRVGNFIGWSQYRKRFVHEHHGKRLP